MIDRPVFRCAVGTARHFASRSMKMHRSVPTEFFPNMVDDEKASPAFVPRLSEGIFLTLGGITGQQTLCLSQAALSVGKLALNPDALFAHVGLPATLRRWCYTSKAGRHSGPGQGRRVAERPRRGSAPSPNRRKRQSEKTSPVNNLNPFDLG